MIVARALTVEKSGRCLLDRIDVELAPSSFTAVVGPNGAGKSTLLKALTGENSIKPGFISYHGKDIASLDALALALQRAVLPQALELSFPFTALEIVRMGAVARGASAPEKEAEKALFRVGLAGFQDRAYPTLSGGEQQRVQFARALAQVPVPMVDGRPMALFLDEPTASLDLCHQLSVLEIARQFANDGGIVLAVLHDLNLVAEFADQVVVLDHGRLVAKGDCAATLTDAVITEVYGIAGVVGRLPEPRVPFILPQARQR